MEEHEKKVVLAIKSLMTSWYIHTSTCCLPIGKKIKNKCVCCDRAKSLSQICYNNQQGNKLFPPFQKCSAHLFNVKERILFNFVCLFFYIKKIIQVCVKKKKKEVNNVFLTYIKAFYKPKSYQCSSHFSHHRYNKIYQKINLVILYCN